MGTEADIVLYFRLRIFLGWASRYHYLPTRQQISFFLA